MSFELDSLSYALLASIFSAAAMLSVRNSRGPDIHPLLLNTQSDVSRVRYPGSSAIYRSRMYPNGSPLLYTMDRSIRTLKDFYGAAFEKYRTNVLVGGRTTAGSYSWSTYEAIEKKSKHIYSGVVHAGALEPMSNNESSFVGIYAANSPDTLATEIGCQCGGLVTIPISADATSSHLSHILRNSGLRVLVVDASLAERALNVIRGGNVAVKVLAILGDGLAANVKQNAEAMGIQLLNIRDVENKGTENPAAQVTPEGTTMATIYYTSADYKEGNKPGVVLTHKNLVSVAASYHAVIPPQQRITPKDRLMHNFAIDNVFGHVLTAVLCVSGGSIAYGDEIANEDVKVDVSSTLAPALEAKPTIYASGAPFLAQVKETIEARYGNSFLFRRGLDKKKAYFEEGRLVTDSKYDMLVFRDIKQKTFGSNIRLVIMDNDDTGSDIASFFRAVIGIQVLKALDLPETCGTAALSMFYDYQLEKAAFGAPLPCNELKLEDMADQGYTSDDTPNPRGEIWIRGNNVFAGYWKDPSATSAVMDPDGWYMTSIIGEIQANGTIKVIGRK
ncbi:long-chain-fatty-acid--ligase 5 isoform 2 [Lichtheimia corymbifera JMRC:FSU:9682]|uniref:Long-chain-fatty-acid--ligase 5 isoform 2 n=1 Tax=Lichtheimia corymbifera JMRC:FSU:9682 TaxID=1263082 RepID=A0A068RLP6_9FUNG|nr:long-chain-fatty-acid--ligase 5 isoform 2 [Lichtheimia corymbifera JMRC:FSU:9682]